DRSAALGTRPSGAAVDGAPRSGTVKRGTHQPGRLVQYAPELLVRRVRQAPPRRDPRRPQRLGLPHVSYSGNGTLVEQGLPELAALVDGPQAGGLDALRDNVRAQTRRPAAFELEHGAVPEDSLAITAAQDQPRPAHALRAGRNDGPAAAHAQVAAD